MPPEDDVKVRGEVVAVLFDGHVKELRKNGLWCALALHMPLERPRARAVWRWRCTALLLCLVVLVACVTCSDSARSLERSRALCGVRRRHGTYPLLRSALVTRTLAWLPRRPAQFDAHLQAAEAAADAEQRRARSPRDGSSDEGSDGDDDGMPPLERNPNRKGWSEDEENTSEDYTTTSGEETENDGAGAEGAAGGDGDGGSGATGAVKGAGHVGAGGAGGETSGPSAAAAGVGGLSLKS